MVGSLLKASRDRSRSRCLTAVQQVIPELPKVLVSITEIEEVRLAEADAHFSVVHFSALHANHAKPPPGLSPREERARKRARRVKGTPRQVKEAVDQRFIVVGSASFPNHAYGGHANVMPCAPINTPSTLADTGMPPYQWSVFTLAGVARKQPELLVPYAQRCEGIACMQRRNEPPVNKKRKPQPQAKPAMKWRRV